ncbi:MAG: alanyl-tRNA editing protein [Holosporales bacterium]|jgi:alanyl-tRNA synthetase|nr:alanyl-tRNA editing protein [Holosporales bacterium]
MTRQLYLQDAYLFESDACIAKYKKDERDMPYLLLDQTIFYPQGGGQPCDHGKIIGGDFEYTVCNIRQTKNEIRHYIELTQKASASTNCKVKCAIDKDRRLLNARHHTAGHLLGNVVELAFPSLKAIKCHAFPGEAYIEFLGADPPDEQLLQKSLQNAIAQDLKTKVFEIDRDSFELVYYKLPYEIPENKNFRVMQIGNFAPVPCGGTHLASIKEIVGITLNKIKHKNSIVRISFGVA